MTADPSAPLHSVEKHFQERSAELQIPPLRFASVGMTKGRAKRPWRVVAGQSAFFITLGGPQAHESSGRDEKFSVLIAFVLDWVLTAFTATNLSSRPERSAVERSAVLTQGL
jgi:hypothetical protein